MSQDEDDLRLNTLNRFSKRSPRLALEEHGHCEVPAGCGGVVLRWTNPDAGVSTILHVASPGESDVFLDGKPVGSARCTLVYGEHALAFHFRPYPLPLERGVLDVFSARTVIPFLCVLLPDIGEVAEEPIPVVATADDGRWRSTTKAPPSDWTSVEFDDATWTRLRASVAAPERVDESFRWRFQRLQAHGAIALELPAEAESWARVKFILRRS